MSEDRPLPLEPALAALLEAERGRPAAPREAQDAVRASLEALLGNGSGTGGGGAGGDPGNGPSGAGPATGAVRPGARAFWARAAPATGLAFVLGGAAGAWIQAHRGTPTVATAIATVALAPASAAPSLPAAP